MAATLSPARFQERTALLGMTIFIGSWAMLFAALFFAYGLVRLRTPAWPPVDLPRLPLGLPAVATLALGLSSAALERGLRQARAGAASAGRVAAAAGLGLLFLGLQTVVWRDMYLGGLRPSSGTYASVFFGLTAFHALHVLVGLVALGYLTVRQALRRPGGVVPLRLWTIYWHMVGVIWGAMFLLVYLV